MCFYSLEHSNMAKKCPWPHRCLPLPRVVAHEGIVSCETISTSVFPKTSDHGPCYGDITPTYNSTTAATWNAKYVSSRASSKQLSTACAKSVHKWLNSWWFWWWFTDYTFSKFYWWRLSLQFEWNWWNSRFFSRLWYLGLLKVLYAVYINQTFGIVLLIAQ